MLYEPLWGPRTPSGIRDKLLGELGLGLRWAGGALGGGSRGLEGLGALGPSVGWVRKSRTQSSFSV